MEIPTVQQTWKLMVLEKSDNIFSDITKGKGKNRTRRQSVENKWGYILKQGLVPQRSNKKKTFQENSR